MATNKTLNPTGVTIAIPAMADKPDASVFSNCIDKEADAINTLNSNKTQILKETSTLTTSAAGWIYFGKNVNVLYAVVNGENPLILYYDASNNRMRSRAYLTTSATEPIIVLEGNTQYEVTHYYYL